MRGIYPAFAGRFSQRFQSPGTGIVRRCRDSLSYVRDNFGGCGLSRRDFRFATAAMREGRMRSVFNGLVASCCFTMAGLAVVVQFDSAGPEGMVRRFLQAGVAVSAVVVGARWLRRPWPRYREAVAFVVWADIGLAIAASTMSTPEARLCSTLYLGIVGVFVGFLLGGRILLAHCGFCLALIIGLVGWAVLFEHRTVMGLFVIYVPALTWTVTVPLGGLTLIDIGRNSIRRTVRSAQHDPLTGLRNRRGMNAAVSSAIRRSSPPSAVIAVCDIDRFKAFNDGQGHAAGDAALLSLAKTLQSLAGDGEITARIGGDEFVLVAFVDDEADLSALLSRMEPLTHGDVDGVALTASVGVAWQTVADAPFSVDDAIRHADAAMYEAKRAGGARCAVYGPAVGQTP
jgi:diguanylate cyclase